MSKIRYDVVILLGGGVNIGGTIDVSTKERLDRAAQIYKSGIVQAIVVCGSHGYKDIEKPLFSEAQVYADYLSKLDVPNDYVYLETESQETLGNLLFAKMQIITQHRWRNLLVIPSQDHATDRIEYLLQKVFGNSYSWDILRVGENRAKENLFREAKALKLTREIGDVFQDGDDEAIFKGLIKAHPAYGGTEWSVEELRKKLG